MKKKSSPSTKKVKELEKARRQQIDAIMEMVHGFSQMHEDQEEQQLRLLLHGHPHHRPIDIDVTIVIKHRYPKDAKHSITAGLRLEDLGHEPSLKPGDFELAVEDMFATVKKSVLEIMHDPDLPDGETIHNRALPTEGSERVH